MEIQLDPSADGIIVITPRGRRRFGAAATVGAIMDHLLDVARGKGAPTTNSLGTAPTAPAPSAPITKLAPRGKARPVKPKPGTITLTLEELLS